ncbi:ABC transporter ATP-binding protein [Enterococcus sp. 10A9_DIV0425]|uniref:ABC transporter ATP-binding protein n=1 Tax=Candidatus Enterococcus wittei TaxID=1987383 RepID=A0A242JWC9_9ENTE|nr:ABC transporter ATP-binding protein [Enterococcus sp. 10A9_DIV0425]OTP09627.1 ABC transporter ATP-binding protein [Enterococcus sp. 10A9_DIV0425]THE15236.1 ABC transporter ATP-binding protein [Enterococcus hirae]
MKKVIEVKHVSKSYGSSTTSVKVLDNVSFSVGEGEFVGIMGPSGAGKTTLMNILSTINLPTVGSVSIQGKEITKMKKNELSDFRRRKIGFIFQEFNLIDTLTAKDNILLPLAVERISKEEMEKKVLHVAQVLGIEELLKRYPDEMSVGQRQRIAAARALIVRPEVIFADEPTGSLDSKSATELLNYLKIINEVEKSTILLVTHDPYTASYCNRILFIKDGVIFSEVVRKGSRKEFFEKVIDMQATIGGGGKLNAL